MSVIPKGDFNPERKTVRVSGIPFPFVSRSRIIRFALGVLPPAFPMKYLKKGPRIPLLSSGRTGAFVSAISTSPLGRTYTHRGWLKPLAKGATFVPGAAIGIPAGDQP